MVTAASLTRRVAVVAALCGALLVGAIPAAGAPASDGDGYVDSTARCTAPDVVVVFGSTATSRVAVCAISDGRYEYRGVRVRDGARVTLLATKSGDGGFVAENDGVTYTVTAKSLTVSAGGRTLREEPMLDFHAPGASTPSPQPPPETSTPPTPLPPPLPAEEGHGG